jgi:hypothetical protein
VDLGNGKVLITVWKAPPEDEDKDASLDQHPYLVRIEKHIVVVHGNEIQQGDALIGLYPVMAYLIP